LTCKNSIPTVKARFLLFLDGIDASETGPMMVVIAYPLPFLYCF
jgi:hypothetical protein